MLCSRDLCCALECVSARAVELLRWNASLLRYLHCGGLNGFMVYCALVCVCVCEGCVSVCVLSSIAMHLT